MYYQPFRSPTVGYVVAGQKLPLQQQTIQPLSIGQWNMPAGYSQYNQTAYANNAGIDVNSMIIINQTFKLEYEIILS